MALPETVTSNELGAALGIGPRQVEILANKGVLTKVKRGRYALAESIRGYLDHRLETEVKRNTPDSADEEWKWQRARGMRIRNDQSERALIPIDDALAAIDAVAGMIPQELQGLASHVSENAEGKRRPEAYCDGLLDRLRERAIKASATIAAGGDALDDDGENDA